jgi:hypothetical protein
MTTIAWDGERIGVDSVCTSRYLTYGHDKIFQSCDGTKIYALCGEMGLALAFVEFLESECGSYDTDIDGDWAILEYDRVGHIMTLYPGNRFGFPVTPPFAIGSGGPFAQAALVLGHTIEEAIGVAIELDPNTGGDITVIELLEY